MTSTQLTQIDRVKIKAEIALSFVIGLIFCTALIFIVFIIPFVAFLFGAFKPGFIERGLFIVGLLFVPFLVISWTNILKYIDLIFGSKLRFQVDNFEIVKKKNHNIVWTKDPINQKFKVYFNVSNHINADKPLIIECTPRGKTLLFISHDTNNLLDANYYSD